MRPYPITVLRGGINRLRVKGGAAADSLYDLQNAYITNAGSVVPRDGTVRTATLDSSTVGLAAANGQFNIFSSQFATGLPPGFVLNVLSDPNNTTASPVKIWFAKPFMGFEYVVAQFNNGDVVHYWLQNSGTWTSGTAYTSASIVLPPVANGIAYQGLRDFPPQPVWTPETTVTSASYVEPTVATGFAYQAVATTGTPVHTGSTEPVWPTVAGGIVQEFGDFDVSTSDAGTTQQSNSQISTASPLSQNITDRYGDSNTVSNSGVFSNATVSTLTLASTKITTWKGGTNYAPGAVVVPTSNQGAFVNAIPDGDFESGTGWTFTDPAGFAQWAYSAALPYQGTGCIEIPGGTSFGVAGAHATMTSYSLVTPGQSVTANAYLAPQNSGANLSLWLQINWYDAADSIISSSGFEQNEQQGGGYRQVSVTGIAPAGAAHARVSIGAGSGTTSRNTGYADLVSWNLANPAKVTNFLFEAVQPAAGSSAATEPTWPTTLGNQVIDGAVTWKAIGTSIITWQAIPLMYSGLTAPTFPTTIGNAVHDYSTYSNVNGYVTTFTSMSWEAVDRHVSDPKDPNSIAVAIGASHVFAGSNDIVAYSAAVNPTDWSSSNNAGYLPTGLNNYGDNPVTVLALYRGNLIAFNSGGYQMWQIDPDPQNMAFLDAQPVGSLWPRAAQSVSNDLIFLTEIGVRNLGTIGATANMAIGDTGQPVDPLVLAQIQAAAYDPFSTYYPGRGQYWLIYGAQVFVLTINGLKGNKSWSRYLFPQVITDATLLNGFLYLRTINNLVWQVNANTQTDDSISYDPTQLALLHFDGSNGQTTTIDSSHNAWLVSLNNATASAALSTAAPKFGTANLAVPANQFSGGTGILYACRFPNAAGGYAPGSTLDIFATAAWTIECWFALTAVGTNTSEAEVFAYGDGVGAQSAGLAVKAKPDGNGTTGHYTLYNEHAFIGGTQGAIFDTGTVAMIPGTWTHIALVENAGSVTLYINGVASGNSAAVNPSLYIQVAYSLYVCPGSDSSYAGVTVPCGVDEFAVWTTARYTANFTPPTSPFSGAGTSLVGVATTGLIQWPYLDMGALGRNKMMVGIDLIGEGSCSVQIASNQADKSTFNDDPGFATSTGVTAPYFIALDDTVPGQPIPIPINAPSVSVILSFTSTTASINTWSWEAANIYIADATGAGAMG